MSQNTPAITEYDKKDYDYSKYWQGKEREYEHLSEIIALERMLERVQYKSRKTFVDLGGGYGRLLPVYAPRFKHSILLDYSIKNLKKGVEQANRSGNPNVSFVAANLYKMPFRDKAIDAGELIRVIHHIKDLPLLIDELARVIHTDLLIDCPNKRHLLAVLRSLFRGKLKQTLSREPYQQPHRQDSKDYLGGEQIFLNYHPKHITTLASKYGFTPKTKLSVSNFRHPKLKKLIPLKALLTFERLTQKLAAPFFFGPNIWLLLSRAGTVTKNTQSEISSSDIFELFACPKCRGDLSRIDRGAKCSECDSEWSLIDGQIWDFRYA